jgi:hypothetical protein
MKQKTRDLDVDFIGGQGALTATEEKELSAYFQSKKAQRKSMAQKPATRLTGKQKLSI